MSRLQTTLSVISLVSGGWMYVPAAVNCPCAPKPPNTKPPVGEIAIETSCWLRAQLGTLSSPAAMTSRAAKLYHLDLMTTPERATRSNSRDGLIYPQESAKNNSLTEPCVSVGHQPFTAFLTTCANSFTSSSVVSKEHIQRTMHSSSIQG